MMRWLSIGILLLAAAAAAQSSVTPQRLDELTAQFDALEKQIEATADPVQGRRLMDEQRSIAAELEAIDRTQLAAADAKFVSLAREMDDAHLALAAMTRREHRYRREPWRREFWRRR